MGTVPGSGERLSVTRRSPGPAPKCLAAGSRFQTPEAPEPPLAQPLALSSPAAPSPASFFLKRSLIKLVSSLSSSLKTVPKLHVEEENFWPPGGLKTCLFLSVFLTCRHARLLVPR